MWHYLFLDYNYNILSPDKLSHFAPDTQSGTDLIDYFLVKF